MGAKPIYLDYAAATPMAAEVYQAMKSYTLAQFYNPSATYGAARQVAADIAVARQRIAHWLGARPSEIIFTAGGTEADNLAIDGIMRQYPAANLVVSAIEHAAVLEPARQFQHRFAKVDSGGLIELANLQRQIDDQTVLVSVMYANNEIGTIEPLGNISKLIADVRKARQQSGNRLPLWLHTDACQAANYSDLHTTRLGVDLMTLNAGKIYGPKQCGALYVRTGIVLAPQIVGGGQERGLRSGTENVANIVGLAVALDKAQTQRKAESARLANLQRQFIQNLQVAIPNLHINGTLKHRLPNNIHITIPGQDNERLMMQLDEAGVQCAVGSACSASNEEPSHVLKAIGLSDATARASLRFSLGRSTTAGQLKTVVKHLRQAVQA